MIKDFLESSDKVSILSQFSERDNLGKMFMIEQLFIIQIVLHLEKNEKRY